MRRRTLPLLFLLALILRLLSITARPLWYDEAFAVFFAGEGPAAMLHGTLAPDAGGHAADIHPLGYYTSLWAWMRVFGRSLLAVRGLSVLLGVGVVALATLLAHALFGRKTATLAALLVALSPFQIHYAQEIRMYVQLTFLLMGTTYAMLKGMHADRPRQAWQWWLLFAVLAACAQYTHNLASIYLLPLALTPVFARYWRSAAATALAGALALGLYAPWLVRLPEQLAKIRGSYWTARPGPSRLLTMLLTYVTNLPLPGLWLPVGLFITLLVIILAIWQTVRAAGRTTRDYPRALWMLWLAFAPPLLLFAISQWQPIFIERALLPSGVAFLLWLAWAFSATRMPAFIRRAVIGLLLVGMAIGLYQHLTYGGFPYGPYAELTASLQTRAAPDDVILHSNKLTMLPAVYYAPALPQRYLADPPGSGSDTLALPTQEVIGLFADATPADAAGDAARVWFIIFDKAAEEFANTGAAANQTDASHLAAHPHLAWLDAHYTLAATEFWDEITLYVYQR